MKTILKIEKNLKTTCNKVYLLTLFENQDRQCTSNYCVHKCRAQKFDNALSF